MDMSCICFKTYKYALRIQHHINVETLAVFNV